MTYCRYFRAILFAVIIVLPAVPAWAQAGFGDDRVMLQGFYWESYRHGHAKYPGHGTKRWYDIVADQADAIRAGRFDLVWLPPPSYAGEHSAGYNPKEYFVLDNSYGTAQQHRAMLERLLSNGIEPVADVVINHRDGTGGWATFRNPDWGTDTITASDEAFRHPLSEVVDTPMAQRGAEEEKPVEYTSHNGTTYQYADYRDIDHTNEQVRRDVIRYLLQLRSMGYRGWRYDMAHGFHARWTGVYNRATQPTFSVGEYDWDKQSEQRGWIYHSATVGGDWRTTSSVFDFMTQFRLKDNKSNYDARYGDMGLITDWTNGIPWKNRAVTFLENHDTGKRTDDDGVPEEGHHHDTFANNWEVEQGYAFVLTHPGVPTVFWKHYFDWGGDLRGKIQALINARKVAGVNAGSAVHPQDNARQKGAYAARVEGRDGGVLYVWLGRDGSQWQPSDSGYRDYREYARGNGWAVWVGLPGNPRVRQAPLKGPLPIPDYREPKDIEVTDAMIQP